MSLDKFRKIENSKGQFLPDNELEVYGKDPVKTSFGKWPNDTLRVIIYDGNNNPLPQKEWGLVRYINQDQFAQYYQKEDKIVSGTTKKYSVDIKKLIKDAGYNIGIFTVEVMFLNSRLGTEDKPNRVWIQQISPSRTELRVLPFDLGDTKWKNTDRLLSDVVNDRYFEDIDGETLSVVGERYKAFLNDEEFKEDIWESVEPFLDLITVNDIQQLFLNRVGQTLYNQILREYFGNRQQILEQKINDIIKHFKLAVKYELEDLDSIIGSKNGSGQSNTNFGKRRNYERVTIDFDLFCFEKLIESIDCFVPVVRDVVETQIEGEIIERPFTDIRKRVTIPTVGDPNPTTTTTTAGPNVTTTTTLTPEIPFDRGQDRVKLRLWTNLPKNLFYDLYPQYQDHELKYNKNITLDDLRYSGGVGIVEIDPLNGELVPHTDLDWYKKNPVPKQEDYTDQTKFSIDWLKWDESRNNAVRRKYYWTDAKMIFAKQKVEQPVEPFEGYYECYRTNEFFFKNINYNHSIPAYYLKDNNGSEKNVDVFKGNFISFSIFPRVVGQYGTVVDRYEQAVKIRDDFKEHPAIKNYKYKNNINIMSRNEWLPKGTGIHNHIVVSNRKYTYGMLKDSFVYETEEWIFDSCVNLNTGETIQTRVGGQGVVLTANNDMDILIKFKRVSKIHPGRHIFSAWHNDCSMYRWFQGMPGQSFGPSGQLYVPFFNENNKEYDLSDISVLSNNVDDLMFTFWFNSTNTINAYSILNQYPIYTSNLYATPGTNDGNSSSGHVVGAPWDQHESIWDLVSVTDPESPNRSLYAPIEQQPQSVKDALASADYREMDFI